MEILKYLAAAIVVIAGLWLIGLAVAAFTRPESVNNFFAKFASSAFSHFLEMALRLLIGAAFVIYAPSMKFSIVFTIFGWMLLLTTAVLLFVPWKLHRKFADGAVSVVAASSSSFLFSRLRILNF